MDSTIALCVERNTDNGWQFIADVDAENSWQSHPIFVALSRERQVSALPLSELTECNWDELVLQHGPNATEVFFTLLECLSKLAGGDTRSLRVVVSGA